MNMPKNRDILSRSEFNRLVKERDGECVKCNNEGEDVHHIIERKLYSNGGYYLNNGVYVCSECHWRCELTLIHPSELYDIVGIENPIYPKRTDSSLKYDKWLNIRTFKTDQFDREIFVKGPMFESEQFQKILNKYLDPNVRYNRLYIDDSKNLHET